MKGTQNSFFLIFAFAIALTLLQACDSDEDGPGPTATAADAYIVYQANGDVRSAEIGTIPGGVARNQILLDMPDSAAPVTALSVSPHAETAAVATFDNATTDSRDWTGSLVFFDLLTGETTQVLDKTALTAVLNFPNQDAAMQIVEIGWESDTVLVAHIRPRTDFLPVASANISLVYSLTTGQALQLSQSGSSEPFAIPMPVNEEKARYENSLQGGVIFVAGEVVGGISGVERYDVTFRLD